jgi:hypothetical protein
MFEKKMERDLQCFDEVTIGDAPTFARIESPHQSNCFCSCEKYPKAPKAVKKIGKIDFSDEVYVKMLEKLDRIHSFSHCLIKWIGLVVHTTLENMFLSPCWTEKSNATAENQRLCSHLVSLDPNFYIASLSRPRSCQNLDGQQKKPNDPQTPPLCLDILGFHRRWKVAVSREPSQW